jgi:hypothetical protein
MIGPSQLGRVIHACNRVWNKFIQSSHTTQKMSTSDINILKSNHVEHVKNLLKYVQNFNDLAKNIEEQVRFPLSNL